MEQIECRVCGIINYGGKVFCTKCRSRLPSDVEHMAQAENPNDFHVLRNFIPGHSTKYLRVTLLVLIICTGIALLFRLAGFEVFGPRFESELPASISPTNDTAWRNIHRDSKHSGFTQADFSNIQSAVQWSVDTESHEFTSPIVFDGIVYIGTYTGRLMALDLLSGSVVWEMATGSPIDSAPAMNESKVIVASREGTIFCLDRSTGYVHWKYSTDSPIYAPLTVHNEWVFAGDLDGHIYALDIETGDKLWRYDGSGSLVSGIAVDGRVVVVSYNDNYLRILDRNDGKFRFKYFNTAGNEGASIVDGKIYLAGRDGKVRAIDSSENEAFYDNIVRWSQVQSFAWGWRDTVPHQRGYIWSFELPRTKFVGFPAISANGLFAAAMEGYVIALNRELGKEKWRFKASNPKIRFTTSPVLIGGWALAGDSEGTLYWFDQDTGEIAFKQSYGFNPITNIVFAEGVLIVSSSNGSLSGSY